jgi:prephenate dehydratase
MKIAVLGASGSFTEKAAESYCKKHRKRFDPVRRETVRGVFAAVQSDKASVGVVPISNSVGGVVTDSVKALADSGVTLVTVIELPVSQNLLVLPGVSRGEVTKLVSHPQALAQCRLYLARNWLKTPKKRHSSTAKAAKDLASGKLSRTTAVIASTEAADLYKLKVLESDIQDSRFNFTQFVVIKCKGTAIKSRMSRLASVRSS